MRMKREIIWVVIILAVFLSLSLPACSSDPQFTPPQNSLQDVRVDPLFREFYDDLGGENYLGPAISPIIGMDGSNCQYTVNALMCQNPNATGVDRYYLAPLGNKLNISDPPQDVQSDDSGLVVDGYQIHPDFIGVYRDLRGALNVGKPLTQVRTNEEQQRIEQYFEKLGFYRNYNDPPGVARLLPYGAHFCGNKCNFPTNAINGQGAIPTPFEAEIQSIGGNGTFGRPVSQPYVVDENEYQQVYENVVVYVTLNNPSEINLRPLPIILGLPTTPPGPKVFGAEQNMTFYTVEGEMGYHVPVAFDQFIKNHGGQQLAGQPIAEPMMVQEENVARQCFENYCIDYPLGSNGNVRLAPLGLKYLEQVNPENIAPYAFPKDALLVQVGELKAQVSSQETQTVYYLVLNKDNQQPVPNVEARIILTLPNGNQMEYYTPPTDNNGISSMVIPAMSDAENGSLIVYEICLDVPTEEPICAADTYLIWNLR